MRKIIKSLVLSGALMTISGCASYSGMVNSFAPPKQKSEVTVGSNTPLEKSNGKSPFCPVPPPKPVPPIEEVYMVMPEDGGKAGTVAVTFNDGKEVVLHGDYSAMSLAGDEKTAYVGDQAQLLKTFGAAVSSLPKAPMSVTLYFILGTDKLTPESKTEAEKIYAEFAQRQVPEVWVIGHTDTVGSEAHNQTLSVKRAEKVRQSLIKLGVPAENIHASGKGEHDLLVNTPDNTKEPKNRCAEINVR